MKAKLRLELEKGNYRQHWRKSIKHFNAINEITFFIRTDEIHELTDQLTEGGRSVHEVEKAKRRLELEKEELQAALEEAEGALEAEEAKVMRAQMEIAGIRSEIDKRLHEKEEEFDSTRLVNTCNNSSYVLRFKVIPGEAGSRTDFFQI